MKLLLVNIPGQEKVTRGLFETAASELGIPIIYVDPTQPLPDLDPEQRYLLYRISVAHQSVEVDLWRRYHCTSFSRDYPLLGTTQYYRFGLAGLPVPPHVRVRGNKPEHLREMAESVGGFPLVVKAPQKTSGNGIGVIKIDSFETLLGLAQLFLEGAKSFVIAKYISHVRGGRLIVIGDRVVSSHEVERHPKDFRTNREAGNPSRKIAFYPDEINQMAVRATHACGQDFGGVDIMFDDDGAPYLTEVNFPCYFATTEQTTGFPVARAMIEHLVARAGDVNRIVQRRWREPLAVPSLESETINRVDPELSETPQPETADSIEEVPPPSKWPRYPADSHAPVLILLNEHNENQRMLAFLKKAAANFGLSTLEIDPTLPGHNFDGSLRYLLYRIAPGHRSEEIRLYKALNCISLLGDYATWGHPNYNRNELFEAAGLRFIKKLRLKDKSIEALEHQANEIGQFPMLIHVWDASTSHYVPVDSLHSFVSTVDYATLLKRSATARPQLATKSFGRLIVLGGRVIAAVKYLTTSSNGYRVDPLTDLAASHDFGEAAEREAVAAVHALEIDFAAVDIQIAENGEAYVDDVIFPCHFQKIQRITGVNIADHVVARMLELLDLRDKARRKHTTLRTFDGMLE